MIDTNVKFRIAETIKSLRTDVELLEHGSFECSESDLLGTLRVNIEVCVKQMGEVHQEVQDLLVRASKFVGRD